MSHREEILARVRSMPDLPGGAPRAVWLLQDPESDPRRLSSELERDVALSANLLRAANSAAFGGSRRISTVRDAVARLGHARVLQWVVASAIGPTTARPVLGYDLPAGKLWEHSLATAVGAEELSRELGLGSPGEFFTAGLLHDVGKIVLGNFVEVDAAALVELSAREDIPFVEAERLRLGIDHAEVGAELLAHWGLPEALVTACRWHHDPEGAPTPSPIADVVHAADALSLAAGMGVGVDGLRVRVSPGVAQRHGLNLARVERTAGRMLSAIAETGDLYSALTGR